MHKVLAFLIVTTLSATVIHQAIADSKDDEDRIKAAKEFSPQEHIEKAVAMLEQQMGRSPDKRVPKKALAKAKCIALFPEVVQAGLGVGGKFGRGMVSCRDKVSNEWGVPVFLRLTSLTFGIQAGGQLADVMMLMMNDKGMNLLLGGKPIVGADAGVAIGPIGREASAGIDVFLQTPMLTYTRTKGVFAGAVLDGAVVTTARKVNRHLYGEDYADAKTLLFLPVKSPDSVDLLQATLEKYAPNLKDEG